MEVCQHEIWLHACKRGINGGKTDKIQLCSAELCFVEPTVMQRLQKLKFAIEQQRPFHDSR